MPTWRVVAVLFMALVCLISAFATIVVPMTEAAVGYRWLWTIGLFFATIGLGGLFMLFLKSCDRAIK